MNKIGIQTIEAGRYLSQPGFLDSGFVLVNPETPITEEMIKRLERWRFYEVYTDGRLIDAPITRAEVEQHSDLMRIDNDSGEEETVRKNREYVASVVTFLEDQFTKMVGGQPIGERVVVDEARKLIEHVKDNRAMVLRLSLYRFDSRNFVVVQSVKTTFYAVTLGLFAKLQPHRLLDLAVASLLHEVGMIRLPSGVYLNQRSYTDFSEAERKAIMAHPVAGYRELTEQHFSEPIARAVLETHENVDGSGYPRAVAGEKINLYARIIRVCDAFAALTASRPYRKAMNGHVAMTEIVRESGRLYDPTFVKLLAYAVGLFPPGTYVSLANGAQGLVLEPNPNNARCPQVRLLVNGKQEVYIERPVVQTTEDGDYRVAAALSDEQIADLLERTQ